jgi:hypothetical protein
MTTATFMKWMPAALLVLACQAPAAHAQSPTGLSEKLHANALSSFRQGRFSEAYGRFISLADAGHGPSAELALWMYLRGMTVFGKDWDSTPEQLKAWSALAGQPTQTMVASHYPRALTPVADRKR